MSHEGGNVPLVGIHSPESWNGDLGQFSTGSCPQRTVGSIPQDSAGRDENERGVYYRSGGKSAELDLEYPAGRNMTIPGMGESGDRCGRYAPYKTCESCGHIVACEHKCKLRKCPECAHGWITDRAQDVTERIQSYTYAQGDGRDKQRVHVAIDVPEGKFTTIEEVLSGYRWAYKKAQTAGIRGGMVAFHGYRIKDEIKTLFRHLKKERDLDGGIWKWVRENEVHWRKQVEYDPHYHVIGFARNVDSEATDAFVKRLSDLDPMWSLTTTESYESVAGVVQYILSHATFDPAGSRPTIRWYGDLAYNQFSPEKALSQGVLDVINRKSEEAVRGDIEEREGCVECDEPDSLISTRDVWPLLQDKEWCKKIGSEQTERVTAAFEWLIGDLKPPPGKRPKSPSEVAEMIDSLVASE